MRKNKFVIIGSAVLWLLCGLIGFYNNTTRISKEKAEQVAINYIKTENLVMESKENFKKEYLTKDLHSIVFRHREWIIVINDGSPTYLFIDAYSAKIIKVDEPFANSFCIEPIQYEEFKKYFSWFLVVNYGVFLWAFLTRNKYGFNDFIYKVAIMHFIASVVFINIISWIYLWGIMIIVLIILSFFHKN